MSSILGVASATNKPRADDFFNTEPWCVDQLCEVETLPHMIWEPCSGARSIVHALEARGFEVIDADMNPRAGQPQADYFRTMKAPASAQITNPPYSVASEWIFHAYHLQLEYLALLLKADFLNAGRAVSLCEQVGYPTRILGLTGRPDFLGQGAGPMNCSWFCWSGWHAKYSIFRCLPVPPKSRRAHGSVPVGEMVDEDDGQVSLFEEPHNGS
jgi:hypothetical protein